MLVSGGGGSQPAYFSYRTIGIFGDSVARGNSTGPGTTPTAETVYQWDAGEANLREITDQDLLEPVAATGGTGGSQWPQCGKDYYEATGLKPTFIDCAIGGSRFYSTSTGFSWYTNDSLFSNAVTKINNCLTFMEKDTLDIAYIGCGINESVNDAIALDATYYSYMTSLIDRINTEWGSPRICIGIPFKGSITTHTVLKRVYKMIRLIKDLCEQYDNVEICGSVANLVGWDGTDSFIQGDGFHLTIAGNNQLGASLARGFASSLSNKNARGMISTLYSSISATAQNGLNAFYNSMGDEFWDYGKINVFSDYGANDKNAVCDLAFHSPASAANSPTINDEGTVLNGTTQRFSWVSLSDMNLNDRFSL